MYIGRIKLKDGLILAPMAGVTNFAYRILCKQMGAILSYTEMISAKAINYRDQKTMQLAYVEPKEKPIGLQLFGHDPGEMVSAVQMMRDHPADLFDINMGCPANKIVKNGDGCALMKDPIAAAHLVKKTVLASDRPVTVKIRSGWDASCDTVDFAKRMEDAGAAAVTLHARTREQMYRGFADWDLIRKVKPVLRIPLIGNGDVQNLQQARQRMEQTGVDGVMIGRAALGNPWVFSNRWANRPKDGLLLYEMIRRHWALLCDLKGERTAHLEMRKHIAWYIKGQKGASSIKRCVFETDDSQCVQRILYEFFMEDRDNG